MLEDVTDVAQFLNLEPETVQSLLEKSTQKERQQFLRSVRGVEILSAELVPGRVVLRWLICLAALERIGTLYVRRARLKTPKGLKEKQFHFRKCFEVLLDDATKRRLLKGLLFTQETEAKQYIARHLVYGKFEMSEDDAIWHDERFCYSDPDSTSSKDACMAWVDRAGATELATFFDQLADKLYGIRCTMIHELLPVQINPKGESVGILWDYNRDGDFYETTLTIEDFDSAVKSAFAKYLTLTARTEI